MSEPKRVVFLIENHGVGGIESVLWSLLENMPQDRYEIHPWFLAGEGRCYERMQAQFPNTRFLGLASYYNPLAWFALGRELAKLKPSIVHAHGYFAGTFGRIVVPWMGIPWVYALYSHYEDTYSFRHYWIERILSWSKGTVAACSKAVSRFAIDRCGVSANKVAVVYNGIDVPDASSWPNRDAVRAKYGLPQNAFTVGTVARLYSGKNVQVLIRAFRHLPEDAHLLVAGDGPEREALGALVDELSLDGRVHFLGLVESSLEPVQAMDLFVQCSYIREGFSLSLVEAMGYGKPVLATDVGGNVEAVSEETGWIVPQNDAEAMGKALKQIYEQRDKLQEMGRAAQERYANHFSSKQLVESVVRLYDELAGDRK